MHQPEANDYITLLRLYGDALRHVADPEGERFALLFLQIIRLLRQPSPFNRTLPAPFLDVARRYVLGDRPTRGHFSYDENRQFFLSDLHDYLELQAGPSQQKA